MAEGPDGLRLQIHVERAEDHAARVVGVAQARAQQWVARAQQVSPVHRLDRHRGRALVHAPIRHLGRQHIEHRTVLAAEDQMHERASRVQIGVLAPIERAASELAQRHLELRAALDGAGPFGERERLGHGRLDCTWRYRLVRAGLSRRSRGSWREWRIREGARPSC